MTRLGVLALATVCICVLAAQLHAVTPSGTLGVGRYWGTGGGSTGLAVNLEVDIPLRADLSFAPSVAFWTVKEEDVSISDITPGAGLKVYLLPENAAVRPYAGARGGLHILMGYSKSYKHFGLNGVAGAGIKVAPSVRVPVEASYGVIFGEEGRTLNVLSFRAGIAVRL